MNKDQERSFRSWAKFLNPEELKSNLIAASIFLAAYETLRTSVMDRIQSFFANGFDENGSIISEEYKINVLALDKSPLRASLLWLNRMSAIDAADLIAIDQIRKHRNELAHDLPKFLGTADAEINIQLLAKIYELVTKIDRYWIREVELTIDPDFDGQEVVDEDITSGNMIFIQMMLRIATGEDSSVIWEEFQKQAGTAHMQGED